MNAHDMPHKPNILLIGCGKMGGALLNIWLARDVTRQVCVVNPSILAPELQKNPKVVHFLFTPKSLNTTIDMVVLAVKPQMMHEALAGITDIISPDTPVLSILAGKTLESIQKHCHPKQPIIRAMPNTPSAIGIGAIVAVGNDFINATQKEHANMLLCAAGSLHWITDESLMDAVTALSGSGPAYVFYLIEVLSKAGRDIGIPGDLSVALARQTVVGAAALAEKQAETPIERLRENVTSSGGTTEAALKILMDGRMDGLFSEALQAAKKRGIYLNKENT